MSGVWKVNPINPGAPTYYSIPSSDPSQITTGANGGMWAGDNAQSGIWSISTSGTAVLEMPALYLYKASFPTAGPSDNIWCLPVNASLTYFNAITGAGGYYNIAGTPELLSMCLGPDNNMWATRGASGIYKVIPSTGAYTLITLDTYGTTWPVSCISGGADGNVWVGLETLPGGYVGGWYVIDASTGAATAYPPGGRVTNIGGWTLDPSGNVWNTDSQSQYASGWIPPLSLNGEPTQGVLLSGLSACVGMTTAGGYLWSAAYQTAGGNGVWQIDPVKYTGAFWPLYKSFPAGICKGPDGNVWVTDQAGAAPPPPPAGDAWHLGILAW